MKFLKITTLSLVAIIVSFLYLACTKNRPHVTVTDTDLSNSTLVQVFDATVSSVRTYVYVDGTPVTGSVLAYGSIFPATAYAFKVKAGLRSFLIKDTLNTSTQAPISFAENFDIGKNYTIFMYDTTPSAKQITVLNDVVIPADTTARVKFVNLIHNSFAVPAVDVFSTRRNENVFTNISKTQSTAYIPYASAFTDTLLVRETGTTNLLASLIGFVPTQKRSYTLIYRGSHRGTRVLSAFTNN